MSDSTTGSTRWVSLEQWRSTMFLIGGLIVLLDVAPVAANIVTGVESATA